MGRVRALRFCSLGSGSRGNATLVEKGGTCVMVDCGLSAREAERRLASVGGKTPDELTAIIVSHEHGDHLRGVARLSQRYGIPVWMTRGTAAAAGAESAGLQLFDSHSPFDVDDLRVQPYPVPHDAREPCQFTVSDGARRVGLLTDAGSVTPHIESVLDGCDALLLECNHDAAMLARSDYPPSVRERIGGRYGHLSNAEAAGLIRGIDCSRLQHVVAAHLSERNNTAQLARVALGAALECETHWVDVAEQDSGFGWRELL